MSQGNESAITKIFVGVAIAVLSAVILALLRINSENGSGADDRNSQTTSPSPISKSPFSTTEISPTPLQTPGTPFNTEPSISPSTKTPDSKNISRVTPLEITTYYKRDRIAAETKFWGKEIEFEAIVMERNINPCYDIDAYPQSPNFSEKLAETTFCIMSFTDPTSSYLAKNTGDTGAGIFKCSLLQEKNLNKNIRQLKVRLVDHGEHRITIKGTVAAIHDSVAPDYNQVISSSGDYEAIFLARCRIIGISNKLE